MSLLSERCGWQLRWPIVCVAGLLSKNIPAHGFLRPLQVFSFPTGGQITRCSKVTISHHSHICAAGAAEAGTDHSADCRLRVVHAAPDGRAGWAGPGRQRPLQCWEGSGESSLHAHSHHKTVSFVEL